MPEELRLSHAEIDTYWTEETENCWTEETHG
jgi:hypothetical protein